ncbi:hypothetical protein BVY04_01700 [bacterium M21]|nr:hypothetical protein BVY04_01700 [bacterium M21]
MDIRNSLFVIEYPHPHDYDIIHVPSNPPNHHYPPGTPRPKRYDNTFASTSAQNDTADLEIDWKKVGTQPHINLDE